MRSLPPDTPEAADLRAWLEETVLADHDYRPELIGEAALLFERDYRGSFLMSLMDGLPAQHPSWAGCKSPSEVFFSALERYLEEIPSHLAHVLGHDGAFWEVRSIYKLPAEKHYLPHNLTLLHREPADEAGATYLMLIADDRKSAVVLADNPYLIPPYASYFCIVFHGDPGRRALFWSHLQTAASAGNSMPS